MRPRPPQLLPLHLLPLRLLLLHPHPLLRPRPPLLQPVRSMPGNILSVNVSQGQAVKSGDILVILEAMKMENEILAPRDGTVAQVVTSKGAVVETGAPLVVLA